MDVHIKAKSVPFNSPLTCSLIVYGIRPCGHFSTELSAKLWLVSEAWQTRQRNKCMWSTLMKFKKMLKVLVCESFIIHDCLVSLIECQYVKNVAWFWSTNNECFFIYSTRLSIFSLATQLIAICNSTAGVYKPGTPGAHFIFWYK